MPWHGAPQLLSIEGVNVATPGQRVPIGTQAVPHHSILQPKQHLGCVSLDVTSELWRICTVSARRW